MTTRQVREIRNAKAKEQGFKCRWCQCGLNMTRNPSPKSMTADHVIPKAFGGADTYENIVASCIKCNAQRGETLSLNLNQVQHTLMKKGIRMRDFDISDYEPVIKQLMNNSYEEKPLTREQAIDKLQRVVLSLDAEPKNLEIQIQVKNTEEGLKAS